MSQRLITPEKQFLTEMCLAQYNFLYGQNVKFEETLIYSVPPIEGYKHCYEINRRIAGDLLRLHLLLNIGDTDLVYPATIEVKPQFKDGVLGDEVFVFRGTIDTAHTLYDGYRLLWIGEDITQIPILLQTDGSPITLVDGSYIALV